MSPLSILLNIHLMKTSSQSSPPGNRQRKLRVAAVQMKFCRTIDENMVAIERLVRTAARRKADAVLFPECAITGYAFDFSSLKKLELNQALMKFASLAEKYRLNILMGTPVFGGRQLFNCLVVFDRSGTLTHCYAKCHLTPDDQKIFTPGNAVSLFEIDGIPVTTVICHERRYPELVRLAVMAGARILFHPNAGLDALSVSRKKRDGKDGVVARAFENAIYYVFANSVGPQGGGKWSAGDSKMVAPDGRVLAIADNEHESVILANLDMEKSTGVYAERGMEHPSFLKSHWKKMIQELKRQAARSLERFDLPVH